MTLKRGFSLFTGIGGIETGLRTCHPRLRFDCCEINEDARTVIRERLSEHASLVHDDVRTLERLPEDIEVVTAGSPCVNFSMANMKTRFGILQEGASSLVMEVFRLLEGAPWVQHVVLENVANMRSLHNGLGLRVVIRRLEELGFCWAYRVIDARAFGLRQRRRRLIIVARRESPPTWLLATDEPKFEPTDAEPFVAFSWIDGNVGSGFGNGCLPTIRAHDTPLRIQSQPAIVPLPVKKNDPSAVVRLTPEEGEQLQGFPAGWTACLPERDRFARIGNSVCVPLFAFVGEHLLDPATEDASFGKPLTDALWDVPGSLPVSAFGGPGRTARSVKCGEFPVRRPMQDLTFLDRSPPLSIKATKGFLHRASRGKSGMPPWLLEALKDHVRVMEGGGSSVS